TTLVQTFRPSSKNEVRAAEAELGVTFPESFRAFLETCGTLLVGTLPFPRPLDLPNRKFPHFQILDREGFGWPDAPIHDRYVFGLGPDVVVRERQTESVVFQTQVARGEVDLRLPKHLIPIWDEWRYYYHCLDISRMRRGECPVIKYCRESFETRPPSPF